MREKAEWEGTEKKTTYLFSVPQVPNHSLLFFLDDSFTLKRAIYVPLSSLSRGEGWSGSLILAGSRGLDLWWHINWAVPLKKRKASVTIGSMLFVELWKLVLFGWKALERCLFTHQNVSNGNCLSPAFWMCVYVSRCACLDAYMLCLLTYVPCLHASSVEHVCMWEIKTGGEGETDERRSTTVSSCHLPLEFPHS